MVSAISIRYRPAGEVATRLLVDYLNLCPHGDGKALARLPDGRRICWECFLAAWMDYAKAKEGTT